MDQESKKLRLVSTRLRVITKANFVFGQRPLSLSLTKLYPDVQEQPRKKDVDKVSTLPDPCVVPPADPRSNQVAAKKKRVWLPVQSECPVCMALSERSRFFLKISAGLLV